MTAKADAIVDEMLAAKVRPDEATFAPMIRAASSSGDFERAMRLLDELSHNGLRPKLRTFAPLLANMCDHDPPELAMALRLWRRMRSEQVRKRACGAWRDVPF
jgi:pentatricopeptide repeat protein